MEEVRIGFIGCGGNARGHMNRLNELEGAKVTAVCDVVDDLAAQAAALTGGEPYADHRRMLDRDDLTAVYISIPVFAHGEPERDVVDRGLPFFVEKPVARTMETAREIEALVASSGLITCVGYQLRYFGSYNAARDLLGGETIGMVIGKYWSGTGRGDTGRWVRQYEKSGGQLVEQATHTIDMMRYLAGEVEEVHARTASRILTEIDCPDAYAVSLSFESGALGALSTWWAYDPKDWSHANVLEVLYGDRHLALSARAATVTAGGERQELTSEDGSIDAVFVDAVRKGDGSGIRSTYSDGLRSLAVSLAAMQSAATNRSVRPDDL